MKFVPIFDENFLYAVVVDGGTDEFSKTFENWLTVSHLFEFFADNFDMLQGGFFGTMTIERAVEITLADAKDFRKRILEIARMKKPAQSRAIEDLFVPLHDGKARDLQRKAKGKQRKSWLRLYALKFYDVIVVTGGGIKLTRSMQESDHLATELQKINSIKDYLIDRGVCDADSFIELIST